jgi:hypothetical protein
MLELDVRENEAPPWYRESLFLAGLDETSERRETSQRLRMSQYVLITCWVHLPEGSAWRVQMGVRQETGQSIPAKHTDTWICLRLRKQRTYSSFRRPAST